MPQRMRDARLQGVQIATRVHRELGIKDQLAQGGGSVAVFQAIARRGHVLLFRPLEGILGLCMQHPSPGVLVTTNRPLSVQRFTAAHELGHLEMGHDFSLDDEINILKPRGTSPKELQEVSANAFGAAFLMPKWLLKNIMEQHNWTADHLLNPLVVYQMSLRLGVSYEAFCWTLLRYKWIHQSAGAQLLQVRPKQIKAELLDGEVLDDPWADVWLLSEHDHNTFIEAGPSDIFVLNLEEHGSGGYLWDVEQLRKAGFHVHQYDHPPTDDVIGASLGRTWKLSPDSTVAGNIQVEEKRPWQPDEVIGRLDVGYSLLGKEAGLPRFQRPQSQAA